MFLIDILKYQNFDSSSLMKLLIVYNYYDLTNDDRIKQIIIGYSDSDMGKAIYNFIVKKQINDFNELFKNNFSKKRKMWYTYYSEWYWRNYMKDDAKAKFISYFYLIFFQNERNCTKRMMNSILSR